MKLNIFKQTPIRLPRQKLLKLFQAVTAEEAKPQANSEINLIVTDDRQIRKLNKQYRGIDRVTDVLSFNIDEQDSGGTFGEIYISVPTMVRQAKEYHVSAANEMLRLTCHGLLHLFGYDHENHTDAECMLAREEYFLNQL